MDAPSLRYSVGPDRTFDEDFIVVGPIGRQTDI